VASDWTGWGKSSKHYSQFFSIAWSTNHLICATSDFVFRCRLICSFFFYIFMSKFIHFIVLSIREMALWKGTKGIYNSENFITFNLPENIFFLYSTIFEMFENLVMFFKYFSKLFKILWINLKGFGLSTRELLKLKLCNFGCIFVYSPNDDVPK
jgi:hypothetical protein